MSRPPLLCAASRKPEPTEVARTLFERCARLEAIDPDNDELQDRLTAIGNLVGGAGGDRREWLAALDAWQGRIRDDRMENGDTLEQADNEAEYLTHEMVGVAAKLLSAPHGAAS